MPLWDYVASGKMVRKGAGSPMPPSLVRFGLFELNTGSRKLHKQGRRVRIQDQPFRILEILLEQPGELVTRDELKKRVWPSDVHVDFELGLNGAIKRLRLALDDSADNPIFIETVPKQGYRFLAPVQRLAAPVEPAKQSAINGLESAGVNESSGRTGQDTASENTHKHSVNRRNSSRAIQIVTAIILLAALLVAGDLLRPVTPPLRVTRIVKLTNSGRAWFQGNLLTDGPRLYYNESIFGAGNQLRQVLLNGNEDTQVSGISPDAIIKGISPDGTTFLGTSRIDNREGLPSALWVEPVIGGPARRLGNINTDEAAWSPSGDLLVYGNENQLLVASRDGTGQRLLATAPGKILYPRWSPDGERIRYTVDGAQSELTIWEVGADGSKLHRLDFHWPGTPGEGFGAWTADGKFYVFASRREGITNLWAIEEKTDWLHRARSEPVQLTAGPINYSRPLPSRDGARLFALGTQVAGELLRYDASRKEFAKFSGGLSADHVDFTRDGKWMTYITFPEGSLWRARGDASEQLQLTFPPQRALNPRWSPNGKRILFVSRRPGELPKIYTISMDGGNAEPVVSESHAQTSASWSPKGDVIYYGRDPYGEGQDLSLYRVDLQTHRTEKIPGTDNLFSPICSPDGRFLASQSTVGDHLLVLIDLQKGTQSVLSKVKVDYPAWSSDSQYLYYNTFASDAPALYRMHVPDGSVEKLMDLPFQTTGVYGLWSGLTPDGFPLLFRSHEQTDVYSLGIR
jgi:Tol biopolymer transport system component/DNA-binding winged helix-turn-helix (wHTH) protein